MNLVPKLSIFSFWLGLTLAAHADFVYQQSHWEIKPGTTTDLTDPNDRKVILILMDRCSHIGEEGDLKGAINAWEELGNRHKGSQVEAVSLLERARLLVARSQFDSAVELLDEIYNRHSNFANFNQVVELQFDIANRFARGERRMLGGWFPWFKDPEHALMLWEKTVRLAPNGPLADESLMRKARLAIQLDNGLDANEALERLISDYPKSPFMPEALEALATLRAKDSMGPAWDQTSTLEAADHLRTLSSQFPKDPRTPEAIARVSVLRDRAARAKLELANFYWYKRNNPEAAKLMANNCRSISPESQAAKDAEALLEEIQNNPMPPKTWADRLLGVYPRPKLVGDNKPTAINDDLDNLGFKKEPIKPATDSDRR